MEPEFEPRGKVEKGRWKRKEGDAETFHTQRKQKNNGDSWEDK